MEQSEWVHGLISVDIWQSKYVQLVEILFFFSGIIRLEHEFETIMGQNSGDN